MPRRILPGIFRHWTLRQKDLRRVVRESWSNFLGEDSLMVAASIAYHALLSIFPFLLLLMSLGGYYIRRLDLATRLATVLQRYLPMKPDFILENLEGISQAYGRVGLVSFLLLLWSSAGVFIPLEKALNRAWEIEKDRSWWRSHLLALAMALVLGVLFLVSSGLIGTNVYVHVWMRRRVFHSATPLVDFFYHSAFFVATFGITLTMFIVLYKWLPNCKIRLRQVLPGALLTAILWEGARSLFTLLLPLFNYRRVYGSIGVVVALMTWAYISSTVMLFGGQLSGALYRGLRDAGGRRTAPAVPAAHSRRGSP